jgi:hypothetical protein
MVSITSTEWREWRDERVLPEINFADDRSRHTTLHTALHSLISLSRSYIRKPLTPYKGI